MKVVLVIHGCWYQKHIAATYDEVADDDLEDLGLETRPSGEHPLQDRDQDVTERRTDQSSVGSHLRNTRGEVVAVLVPVLCDPGSEQLLKCRERSGREHLGAQRIAL